MKKARVKIDGRAYDTVPYWWWRLVGSNGKIACQSKTFATRSSALRAARRFLELAKNAEIEK